MFGTPVGTAVKAPNPEGIVENAPVVDKINFMLDEAFVAIYDVENSLEMLTSTIPARIRGSAKIQVSIDAE